MGHVCVSKPTDLLDLLHEFFGSDRREVLLQRVENSSKRLTYRFRIVQRPSQDANWHSAFPIDDSSFKITSVPFNRVGLFRWKRRDIGLEELFQLLGVF